MWVVKIPSFNHHSLWNTFLGKHIVIAAHTRELHINAYFLMPGDPGSLSGMTYLIKVDE